MAERETKVPGVESMRLGTFVETRVSGRVTGDMLRQMIADYERLGVGPIWSIRAEAVGTYTPDAMQEAIRGFTRLARERGLRRIVALLTSATVRMGASVVAMSLRAAGSRLEVRVGSTKEEAAAAIQLPSPHSA